MSVSQHYEPEALIALLNRDSNDGSRDEHVASCAECAELLDVYRSMAVCLSDEAVWNTAPLSEEPVPQTISALRTAAQAMRREDQLAEALVSELTAGSRDEWLPRLLADAKYRTAGVVRGLSAASDAVALKSPGDDLELTRLSTEVADHLDPAEHPAGVVARLRGSAWRDRAYALNSAGDTAAALDAVTLAERHYAALPAADHDLGRLELTRALVLRGLDRFDEGLRAVRTAGGIFAANADLHRMRLARSIEAYLVYRAGDVRKALQLWCVLEDDLSRNGDPMRGSVLHNMSVAYRDAGDLEAAINCLKQAMEAHAAAGETVNLAKTRWVVARSSFRRIAGRSRCHSR